MLSLLPRVAGTGNVKTTATVQPAGITLIALRATRCTTGRHKVRNKFEPSQ
jgi:hypothetical protein